MIEYIAAAAGLGISYGIYRKRKSTKRNEFLTNYQFPEYLHKKLAEKHPDLSRGDICTVFNALKDYFIIHARTTKHGIAMPSKIVDDAWHEFILVTKEYEHFCRNAFGRFIHHTPSEAMQSENSAQNSLKLAWKYACEQNKIDPKKPDRLPRLFALDARFNVKDGFTYTLNKSEGKDRIFNARHIQCMATAAAAGTGAALLAGATSDCSSGGDSGGCSSGCSGGCGS